MTNIDDDYFGVCPQCHRHDGYVNVGRSHWFFCKQHKLKWCAGANLFSGWHEETEEEQRRQYDEVGLGEFDEVMPAALIAAAHSEDRSKEADFPF